jgi:hypothetical protein
MTAKGPETISSHVRTQLHGRGARLHIALLGRTSLHIALAGWHDKTGREKRLAGIELLLLHGSEV